MPGNMKDSLDVCDHDFKVKLVSMILHFPLDTQVHRYRLNFKKSLDCTWVILFLSMTNLESDKKLRGKCQGVEDACYT